MSNVRQRKPISVTTKPERPGDEDVQPNARWSLLCKIVLFVFIILPFTCLLACIVLIESPINPEPITDSLPEPPKLEGPLAQNDLLVFQGERLFEGQVIGAESIVYQSGHLYTGTADGKILHIDLMTKIIDTVTTLGPPPCGQIIDEKRCGRPLGMRFDKDGYLIVVDAYLGMYKINVASRDAFQLFPGSMKVDGKKLGVLNDLDIASDGTIYFTETTPYRRENFMLEFLEGRAQGRLLKYNPAENKTKVLYKNLYFPNGVQLSKDDSYLLICETSKARIIKYHISGPKQGTIEMFAENLPGLPDNIRRSSGGGYWVAFGACRDAERFNLLDKLQPYPWIRKQLAKIPARFLISTFPACTLIIEFDKEGNIIRSLKDPNGEKFSYLSEVHDDAGYLYLGSFIVPYIGKVNTYKKPVVG